MSQSDSPLTSTTDTEGDAMRTGTRLASMTLLAGLVLAGAACDENGGDEVISEEEDAREDGGAVEET